MYSIDAHYTRGLATQQASPRSIEFWSDLQTRLKNNDSLDVLNEKEFSLQIEKMENSQQISKLFNETLEVARESRRLSFFKAVLEKKVNNGRILSELCCLVEKMRRWSELRDFLRDLSLYGEERRQVIFELLKPLVEHWPDISMEELKEATGYLLFTEQEKARILNAAIFSHNMGLIRCFSDVPDLDSVKARRIITSAQYNNKVEVLQFFLEKEGGRSVLEPLLKLHLEDWKKSHPVLYWISVFYSSEILRNWIPYLTDEEVKVFCIPEQIKITDFIFNQVLEVLVEASSCHSHEFDLERRPRREAVYEKFAIAYQQLQHEKWRALDGGRLHFTYQAGRIGNRDERWAYLIRRLIEDAKTSKLSHSHTDLFDRYDWINRDECIEYYIDKLSEKDLRDAFTAEMTMAFMVKAISLSE